MRASVRRFSALAAFAAWACTGYAGAGGEAARVDGSALMGTWTNAAGARLDLKPEWRMQGEGLHDALAEGTSCPETVAGRWTFFSAPDHAGSSLADGRTTSGDHVALMVDELDTPCALSAMVRRDGQGLNLCLVEDPDSDCSAEELLRPVNAMAE
ncbi:hypothetical protein [Streptomyces tritici]|uniref:hypothetical protein n=1 Tax=Streptomyces tritici TaxID=2054410 RepID=UPI003AF114DC